MNKPQEKRQERYITVSGPIVGRIHRRDGETEEETVARAETFLNGVLSNYATSLGFRHGVGPEARLTKDDDIETEEDAAEYLGVPANHLV